MAAKLIITRKGEWFNRTKPFKVFINENEHGIIKNDDTVEFVLEPGMYTVQCRHNWMSSPVFTVELGEGINAYLTVSNGMKYFVPLYVLMLIGLLLPLYFKFAKLPLPEEMNVIRVVLVLPALIYILLYLSLWKNKYIRIEEDKTSPFR